LLLTFLPMSNPKLDTLVQNNNTTIAIIENVLSDNLFFQLHRWLQSLDYKGKNSYRHTQLDREQVWFHQDGTYFCTSWKKEYDRWKGNKYPLFLDVVQRKIISCIKDILGDHDIELDLSQHNSCLINRYLNGKQYIRPHSDSQESFGNEPIIVGYSIGASRKIRFDSKLNHGQSMEFQLKSNSVFIMMGRSQLDWEHSIPIDEDCEIPRYSMTIRHHLG
jgi:hypothetical protein